jgi:hypothetical protein
MPQWKYMARAEVGFATESTGVYSNPGIDRFAGRLSAVREISDNILKMAFAFKICRWWHAAWGSVVPPAKCSRKALVGIRDERHQASFKAQLQRS